MGRLTDLGLQYGTDKAEHHGFTEFYEEYFSKFSEPNILEVGILDGASLKMYEDYFNNKAFIVGIDINDKSHLRNVILEILQGDILNTDSAERCKEAVSNLGRKYDIIIDDGGHYMNQQQITLLNLWDLLAPGGIFIIEDLHTSGLPDYNPDNTTTTLDVLGGMRDRRYKESLYLNEEQQKKIASEIQEIKIWSKERTNQQGHALQASITSVIVKAGINPKKLVEELKEEVATYPTLKYDIPQKIVTVYEPETGGVDATNGNVTFELDNELKLQQLANTPDEPEEKENVIQERQDEEPEDAHIEEHVDVVEHNDLSLLALGHMQEINEDELTIENITAKQLELQKQYERLEAIKMRLLSK